MLKAYLLRDRLRAAYELADLAPYHVQHSLWHVALGGPLDIRATMLIYDGKVVLTQGAAGGVAELFRKVRALPEKPHFHLQHGHERAAASRFTLKTYALWRMGLTREAFVRPKMPPAFGVSDLGSAELSEAEALLGAVFGTGLFDPSLRGRPHVGVRMGGRLVSMAGTLAINESLGIAVIGPVATLPEHRKRGYAAACTAALCERLFERVDTIALSVRQSVPAAHALYKKLGFADHHSYLEGSGVARKHRA
jgi:ribosomal protein S18 acetylase RimI-like enzyme